MQAATFILVRVVVGCNAHCMLRLCGVTCRRVAIARHLLRYGHRTGVLVQQQRRCGDAVCSRRSDRRCWRWRARWRWSYGVFLLHEQSRRRKPEKLRSLDSWPVVGGEVWGLCRDLNGDWHTSRDDAYGTQKTSRLCEVNVSDSCDVL